MKIICEQQDLNRRLSLIRHAVPNRSPMPILTYMQLVAAQGHLKLTATNQEISITCRLDGDVMEEGSTTVPAKMFIELIGSLRPGLVELVADEETHSIYIRSQGVNTTMKGMDPSEYPTIPSAEGDETPVQLDAKQVKEIITQVAFAAADDDTRPVLTAVYVDTRDEQLTFAAADSYRLAVRSTPLPAGAHIEDNILIPAKTLTELARILPNKGTVEMIVTPNRSQVLFHTPNVDLVSRLIEGKFPPFRGIIPKEYTTRAIIETREFAAAVRTVMPFARDSSNITRLKLRGGNSELEPGELTVEATAEDVGSSVSTVHASIDGPEQKIIFNARYLAEVLAVIDTPEVALEITNEMRPVVIRPVGSEDYTYIIMPMSANQ